MDPEIQNMLDEGIAALRAGRKDEARSKLMQVINADERSEFAWLYLSEAVDNDEDRQICLENVLAINSANERAEIELKVLEEKMAREAAKAGIICPECGITNPSGSQRCLNCYADLAEAIATPPPLPGESTQVEGVAQKPTPREVRHKSFMEMFDTWAEMFALPKQERLDEEHAYARWGLVVPGVFIASGILCFFALLTNVGITLLSPDGKPNPTLLVAETCGRVVVGMIILQVSFFFYSGLYYLVARLLKGQGEFVVHSYLLSLVFGPYSLVFGIIIPLMLLGAVNPTLGLIPVLAALPVLIWGLIMSVRALKSAHGYGTSAALGTIFLPGIFFACVAFLLSVLLAGSLLTTLRFALPEFPAEMPEISPPPIQQPTPTLPVGGEPRSDIPVPEEATIRVRSAAQIQYDIFQSPEAIGSYYKTEMPLQGWNPDTPNVVEAERVLLAYSRPGASVLIQASRSSESSPTRVVIDISEF
jgi:hypothetical protein